MVILTHHGFHKEHGWAGDVAQWYSAHLHAHEPGVRSQTLNQVGGEPNSILFAHRIQSEVLQELGR